MRNTHQHAKCGSFATAVRPKHSKNLTAFYFQVKLIDSTKLPEILGELLNG